jgi:hypothetical protein
MDNTPVAPAPETPETQKTSEKEVPWNKILIGLGVILLLTAIGGISYFFGTQSDGASELSPTPTVFSSPTPFATGTIAPTKSQTPTPTPKIITKTLSSDSSLDGFQSSNGGGNKGLDIRAGRNVNLVTRGFVSFDLSSIPDGATVTEVTLRLYQAKIIGDPYGAGGALKIDHLNFGNSLENADYALAALLANFSTLTNNAVVEWKDADVTEQVKDDLKDNRTRSQFRVHFTTENTGGDLTGDFTYLESADDSEGTGKTPELVIKYH